MKKQIQLRNLTWTRVEHRQELESRYSLLRLKFNSRRFKIFWRLFFPKQTVWDTDYTGTIEGYMPTLNSTEVEIKS